MEESSKAKFRKVLLEVPFADWPESLRRAAISECMLPRGKKQVTELIEIGKHEEAKRNLVNLVLEEKPILNLEDL